MIERQGRPEGSGRRVVVLVSRFNAEVTGLLEEGAVAAFRAHGVAEGDLEVIRVPGAWELPGVAARVLGRGGVDAIVALGCVIRGETPHFDYVAGEAARGLAELGRGPEGVPVVFGVLTTDTLEQAMVRAGARSDEPRDNKGWESAEVALELANLYGELR
jgi:6,7-dimethyl-8-ribityllumazine synthase